MKEIVIFADAYPRIKNALYIATHNYPKRPITIVILGNPDLFKVFNAINEKLFHNALKLIYFELFHPDPRRAKASGLNKIFYVLSDIVRERRFLKETFDKYLAEVEGCEVFFFDRGFVQFSLMKRLSKRNRLVYISSYPTQVTPSQYTPTNIVDLARLIIFKLTYGRGIALGKLPHIKGFPHMSDKFLEKEVDRVIDGEERDEIMKDFDISQFKIFDVGKYSVLYFPQSLLESDDIANKDTYRREMADIFSVISKYFPENEVACKYHPGYHESEKTVVKTGDVLPDFIPAELVYNDNVKMYLGVFSSAIANVEKGLAVSLMYLISFKDDAIREQLKGILVRMSHSEILFPKSLDEFEEILIGLRSNERK
ncbi:MAG: hypothetical protein ABID54_03570 [Pseudomonadota bacterium]